MSRVLPFCVVLLAGCVRSGDSEPLTVSKLFSDGAVLQRNAPVSVWGTAPGRAQITVALDEAAQSVQATPDGRWTATLEPRAAGGPHSLTISTFDDTLRISDVWFGDVWIASGQSNMAWTVTASANPAEEIQAADDSLLRHYKVPLSWAYEPVDTLAGGEWHTAQPEHVGAFSAVGYYFARHLRTVVDAPIGILNTSWGGSRVEAWMDPTALQLGADEITAQLDAPRIRADSLTRVFQETYGASAEMDPGMVDSVAIWNQPDEDLSHWTDIAVPGAWESGGLDGLNGVAWYRTTFVLDDATADATLHLGFVDDRDMTWINGHLVGQTDRYLAVREYAVSADILTEGENTLVIRVHDTGGNGGMVVGDNPLELSTAGETIPLAGTWKIRVGHFIVSPNGNPNQLPTLLYNHMIHPIVDFPVTGFIWYQGESNGNSVEDATEYATQFQSMITRWRELWNNEYAPFLFVSLASFREAPEDPAESNWALLRESQSAALELDKVGQAITLDIGDAYDIHPKNKQDVGLRLALWARALAYGEDLVHSGPIYRDHAIEDGRVSITFDHVGGGLTAADDELDGFAIAGADGPFVWANAHIEDNVVIVSHPSVPDPAAVRYAWAYNPERANLINAEGLPAAPFRTGR